MNARSGPCRPIVQSLTLLMLRRRASSAPAFLPGAASVSTPLPVCTRDSGLATNEVQYCVDNAWSACWGEEVAFRRLLGAAVPTTSSIMLGIATPGTAAARAVACGLVISTVL